MVSFVPSGVVGLECIGTTEWVLAFRVSSKIAKLAEKRAKLNDACHNGSWLEESSDMQFLDAIPPLSSTLIRSAVRSPNDTSMMTSMSFATLQIPTCDPREGEDEIDKKSFER